MKRTRQSWKRIVRFTLRSPGGVALLLITVLFVQQLVLVGSSASAESPLVQSSGAEVAVVRHAPILNGRVEGSLRQLTGESVTFNSGGAVTGDLFVPGTPTVRLNGTPTFGGTVNGSGSPQPTGYTVTLNSGSTLGRLIRRTNPIALADVATPPASTGTRNVVINSSGQSAGDYSTLRDLTLNGNVGLYNVPAGTYRNFTANGGGFVFGVPGSTQPAVYNISRLILNGNSQVQLAGPVVLTLGNALTVNSSNFGSPANPGWLTLRISSGGLTLNSSAAIYGHVRAPYGTVSVNSASLQGSVHCDRLIVNGSNSLLTGVPFTPGSLQSISPTRGTQAQTVNVTLFGSGTHWIAGQTRASFGGEVSVGGSPAGELGLVTVTSETTAIAALTISPTAALGKRTVRVVTAISGGESEDLSVPGSFVVTAITPPGAAETSVSTIAGSDNQPGFADGPATSARFRSLSGLAIGSDDAIYVADAGNNRIRVVREQPDHSRVVQTVAGDGTAAFRDGAGAQARFNNPQGIAIDAGGALYVADTGNNRIRRITPDGTVSTLAGDGTAGYRNGTGAQAQLNGPRGVALDQLGNVYVADTGNSALRRINVSGNVETVAGDGTTGNTDSPNARFNGLAGVTVDGTTVYVYLSDTQNHRIRRVDPTGAVITIAGADRGFADGSASNARFAEPAGITLDGSGNLCIADSINSLVRSVNLELATQSSPNAVRTLAGTGEEGLVNGPGNVARFSSPRGIATSLSGAIIVADTANNVLRRILLPPAINFFSPARARTNQTVLINGERFDPRSPAFNTVKFTKTGGGQTTAQVVSATRTELSVVVPVDAATGPVTVTTEGGTATSPSPFEVFVPPAPVIVDFNPKQGTVGSRVTLLGSDLKLDLDETVVTFAGPTLRLPALVNSATASQVEVTVPNGAITGRIELTTAGGSTMTATAFTVVGDEDFQVTVSPSTASAVQRSSATYIVALTSSLADFQKMATLSQTGLPEGTLVTFDPEQITSGARSTLQVNLKDVNLSPGGYPFTIRAEVEVSGRLEVRTASATLNVLASGQTTLSGRVLSSDNEPIMGAIASLDGKSATTDSAGAFILAGVSAGTARPLVVDGRTASSPNRTYPLIIEPADIVAGQANVVPYTFFLPPIDIEAEVEVIPGVATLAHNERLPGLEMNVPAGANLRNRDGSPVARVSITPLAIDRTPAPLPENVTAAMVFTSQPGGALTDIPIPVIYPNLTGANPNTTMPLYAFDHDRVEWYVYGTGRVSADGKTISPEIDPNTGRPFGLRDFSWHFPSPPPNPDTRKNDDCPKNRTGNTVDLASGYKIEVHTDFAFGGARGGLALTRTYTSGFGAQNIVGRFGRGTKDNYDIKLTGTFNEGGAGRFVDIEGEAGDLFSYDSKEGGTLIFKTQQGVTQLGDEIRRLANGTLEYRYANGNKLRFDQDGRLTGTVDRNGNASTLDYSGTNLVSITDAVGRTISFNYDSNDRIISAFDPVGHEWKYEYNSIGALSKVTDPLNQSVRYSYDTNGRLLSLTDKRGNVTKLLTYDGAGRVLTQRFADGGVERYDYTLSGTIVTGVTVTDPLGRKKRMRFDAGGYVTETEDALGQKASITRDLTTGVPLSTQGPCGCTEAAKTFDSRGNLLSSVDRRGQAMSMEYEPGSNRLTKVTDRDNKEIRLTYDSRGNETSRTDALNQTTRSAYDGFGQLTSTTDPLNHVTRFEYDEFGNIVAEIDALDNRTTFERDILGRVTAMIDPLGRRSETTYDEIGRVKTTLNTAGATTRYFYDAENNLVRLTDQLGQSWRGTFDSKNRIIAATDPLNRVSRTEYDFLNQVVSTTSPAGRVVRNTYNKRGQLATMTDPQNQVVKYTTDSRGNVTSVADYRGQVTTFFYDELSRPTGMRDPLGRSSTLTYNANDKVKTATDRLGRVTTYNYDAGNRLTSITFPDATVTYTYDAASRITRIDDSQSGSVVWTHDAADRMLTETTANGVVTYTYNSAGQVESLLAADRAPVNYQYDSAGRLEQITQGPETFTYTYDPLSRLIRLDRPNGIRTEMTYDAVDRQKRLAHLNSLDQLLEDQRFTYNLDSQITAISSLAAAPLLPPPAVAAPADAANRITQFGSTTFTFDDQGSTITRTDATGETKYEWDGRGRLKTVKLPDGTEVNYGYDAMGRWSSRSKGVQTTKFLYDKMDLVLESELNGNSVEYLNSQDIDSKLRQASSLSGSLYFLGDQVGSTLALTNSAGGIVERPAYEPFGNTNGISLSRIGFTGRERDNDTKLMNYRARWYDPEVGRFISEDPAGFAGGLNKYSYVSNDPVSKRDPFGLYELDVHYYLTLYLAMQTGCFSPEESREIAEGNQHTDENDWTSPALGTTERQRRANEFYHALHGRDHSTYLKLHWDVAMRGQNGSTADLGIYLHYLQDTFSHAGYTGATWGHARGTHWVDKTSFDVPKAMRMAAATWNALNKFAKEKRCGCEGPLFIPWWDTVLDFAKASGGGWWSRMRNAIEDNDESYMNRKIEILNVPRRKPR